MATWREEVNTPDSTDLIQDRRSLTCEAVANPVAIDGKRPEAD